MKFWGYLFFGIRIRIFFCGSGSGPDKNMRIRADPDPKPWLILFYFINEYPNHLTFVMLLEDAT